MLIAAFADIHANKQAFSACLEHARSNGVHKIYLLGDYVGYGADPEWCVDTVMELVAAGAIAILGNHDSAIGNPRESMNTVATSVVEWTRGVLSAPLRTFLAGLPLVHQDEALDHLLVHGDASAPASWRYVREMDDAVRSLKATERPLTLCGHTHHPALFSLSATGKMIAFTPVSGCAVPLLPTRKWLAVSGAVGQPRDNNPAAAYIMIDTEKREITYCRVPYDIEGAIAAIRRSGLPEVLARRLQAGR